MLDSRHVPIEFAGKDGFHWFIGQVAPDPTWRTKNNQNFQNGYRAKVRILGYHPGENEEEGGIDDVNLPWAHFLVSPQFGAGNNYGGTSFALQGGEMVFGFFLDGEEGQQPVVLGCFYANEGAFGFTEFAEVLDKATTGFYPVRYDEEIQYGKHIRPITPSENKPADPGGVTDSNSQVLNQDLLKTSTMNKYQDNKVEKIEQADAECTKPAGMGGEVTKILQTFLDSVNRLEQYKDGYVDPILGTLVNMDKMVDKAARELDGAISGIVRKARTEMFKTINEGVENALTFLDPENLIKELEVKKQQDTIFCLIENFLKGLQNMIKNFLKELLGKLLSMPLCAAEQFLGGLLSDIADKIQGIIAPFTAAVGQLAGITIPSFMGLIEKAMELAQVGLAFLSCEDNECNPQPYDFITNIGPDPKSVMNLNNVLSTATGILSGQGIEGVVKGMFPGIEAVSGAVNKVLGIKGAVSSLSVGNMESLVGGCNPFQKRCGPPRIEIFGGGGIGAVANAVINETGKVVGVNMQSLGLGFTAPPYVSIFDDCNRGGGATGHAVINPITGEVENVVITNPGSGYLGPETATSDDEGVDVIGVIDGAEVVSTGGGYSPETTITTPGGCQLTPTIENGRIVGVSGQCDLGLTDIPKLTIKDPTGKGFGAIIRPVTKFTERKTYEETVAAIPATATLVRVIDCARIY